MLCLVADLRKNIKVNDLQRKPNPFVEHIHDVAPFFAIAPLILFEKHVDIKARCGPPCHVHGMLTGPRAMGGWCRSGREPMLFLFDLMLIFDFLLIFFSVQD